MEKKKVRDWKHDGDYERTFTGSIEGRVTSVENKKRFSRIWIIVWKKGSKQFSEGYMEPVEIPTVVQEKIALNQQVLYAEQEKNNKRFRMHWI